MFSDHYQYVAVTGLPEARPDHGTFTQNGVVTVSLSMSLTNTIASNSRRHGPFCTWLQRKGNKSLQRARGDPWSRYRWVQYLGSMRFEWESLKSDIWYIFLQPNLKFDLDSTVDHAQQVFFVANEPVFSSLAIQWILRPAWNRKFINSSY